MVQSVRTDKVYSLFTKEHKIYGYYQQPADLQIQLPKRFNSSVDNMIPANISHIRFKHNFNRAIDNLPCNITHLQVGKKFNKTLDHLPKSLKDLTVGRDFNRYIDHLPT
eukprot:TRINITY_DN5441_c0_g1_i1.p1 TRINITY_DN5441_c0_g1~~TRINITY_DN5441_c0_g1_i1.p1  ORF type:complete len:109 (-),score=8.52 TRINITY_DN5441_c0_g1_i1:280-606(-)